MCVLTHYVLGDLTNNNLFSQLKLIILQTIFKMQ